MKQFVTLLVSFLLPIVASAQKIDIDLGIKLGANFTNINGKYWENGYKANLLGGAFLGVNGKRLGVQLEGIFSQATFVTGDRFNEIYSDLLQTGKDSIKNGSFKVNYLSVPLLLNIKLFSRAVIQIGPQFSGVVMVNDRDELVKDAGELFKSSFDGVIGLWLNLPARLNLGARYVIGLSNINKSDGMNSAGQEIDDAWKHRTLQLHIGYSIL
ncbi:MAG TPA: outer membrane beta-barrel protein [Flavipsychrobacter sp.]|nr:outer membrane beta-barrel protein [Flavipsychrobacter sp.]